MRKEIASQAKTVTKKFTKTCGGNVLKSKMLDEAGRILLQKKLDETHQITKSYDISLGMIKLNKIL